MGSLLLLLIALPLQHGEDPASLSGTFTTAPGLEVSLFAAEPLLENPVAISVDGTGRVHVVETHRYLRSVFDVVTYQPEWLPEDLSFDTVADRRAFLLRSFAGDPSVLSADAEVLRRLVDVDGDGRADAGATLLRGFQRPECGPIAGVLARRDGVYVACVPDLVRVDRRGSSEVLASGFGVHVGVSGHDLHGLVLGPDGRLWFSMGDRGAHVRTAEGRLLDLPDTGAVLRCELDGSGLEVVAIGLRNPQELAFDREGNLFTADNDTAGADRSRIVHVVPGGDHGWRCSYQHMPGFGPWVQEELWRGGPGGTLPHAGYVAQGPAGLGFDPGTGPGRAWRGRFLVCDFPGGVLSFDVEPRGATFRTGEGERVLWNLWPTDLDWAPDGSLLVSDWVAGWQQPHKGRIWRVVDAASGEGEVALGRDAARILAVDLAMLPVEDRLDMLGHPDRRVRLEAQVSLAGEGVGALEPLMRRLDPAGRDALQRMHALQALAQVLRVEVPGEERAAEALVAALADPAPAVRAVAARSIGELAPAGSLDPLLAALGDPEDRVAFEAAVAIARLGPRAALRWLEREEPLPFPEGAEGSPRVAGALVARLGRGGEDAYLEHAVSLGLCAWLDDAGLAALADAPELPVRRAALTALRRVRSERVTRFLAGPTLADAARAIHDVPIEAARDALADLQPAAWGADLLPVGRRVLAARFARGTRGDAAFLVERALDQDLPAELRTLALELLGRWARPGPLDPVVGLWRPIPERDGAPAREALLPHLEELVRGEEGGPALDILASLELHDASSVLEALARDRDLDPRRRAAVVETWLELARRGLPPDLADELLLHPSEDLRRVALEHAGDGGEGADLAELVLAPGERTALGAAALARLLRGPAEEAAAVVVAGLEALQRDGSHPLAIELLEAAGDLGLPELMERRAVLLTSWSAEGALGPYRPALAGGDAARGRAVFHDKSSLECLRCHAVARPGDDEDKVGPSLADVGARLSPLELLESIVQPSARIADGYEQVVLALDDGTLATGLIVREDAEELVLRTAQGELETLRQDWIEGRGTGLSAMPTDLASRLTLRELRDLRAYLEALD